MYRVGLFFLLFLTSLLSFANKPKAANWTEEMLKSMTLEEKIGQLFMIAAYSNKTSTYEEELEKTIKKYNIGGLIFFQGEPVNQVNLTNRYQKAAKYPLMIGMDAEHGIGWRLKTAMEFPRMLTNGAISNDTLIYQLGETIARHCKEIGVHVNFAPVADINSNALNPVIGVRSFGENREEVSRKAIMYMKGSLAQNVLPVAKHFPGHGDTDVDSHQALPAIHQTYARIDSVEFYPYKKMIEAQLPAIMVAHLNVHALDSGNVPASLSPVIIHTFLRKQLKFDGLCFTDAMNMKGVTEGLEKGEAELRALMAGNDILLFPEDVEKAIEKIKQAIADGVLREEEIDAKCRKVLMAKHQYVLSNIKPIKTAHLWSRINSPKDFALKQELYRNAITLVKNDHSILPLERLDTLKIASLNFGSKNTNGFQEMLTKYTSVYNCVTDDELTDTEISELENRLSPYNCLIIYNNTCSNNASKNFGYSVKLAKLINRLHDKKIILCHPAIPYGLAGYCDLPVDAIVISYDDHLYAQQYAAQALFGGIAVSGRLPVSINVGFPAGKGIVTPKIRLGYSTPEMCGVSSSLLSGIDSLCKMAIQTEATPGCQVLVAKDGYVIYNKAFGYHTYKKKIENRTSDIYDLASVTKITATLPAVMKLYEEQKIKLDAPLADYYSPLKNTNKKKITVKEVLTHSAGLKAYIPSFADAIDKKALPGRLFTTAPTKENRLRLKDKLYINPDYTFRDSTLSRTPRENYEPFTPGLYICPAYRDSAILNILNSELDPRKNYIYSDLGFILLQQAIEEISQEQLDEFCKNTFYQKLGAGHTDFKANEHFDSDLIIPSTVDRLYRKTEVKGYVHDPTASILRGVAGHAGLFSTAEDLAKIMELYLNNGRYGGEVYFSPETVAIFTNKANVSQNNRRGLGFDKPETTPAKSSPTCAAAPASSYGHTGFTGTMVWCDPDNHLSYIFLSNRTYPDEFNTRLSEENIRTKIQSVIYQAIRN